MSWRAPYLHLRCLLSSTWYLLRLFCFYSLELYGGTIIQLTSRSTLGGMSLIFASGVGRSANKPSVKSLSRRCFGQLVQSLALDKIGGFLGLRGSRNKQ